MKLPQNNSQSGITLLLSVFILSGISLIAVTVSALAIQSIRNSRAVVFSEPAIGQAQSGAEESLWSIKRNTGTTPPSCDSNSTKKSDTQGSIWSARSYCQDYSGATFELTPNVAQVFYLYDPDYPNGVPDASCTLNGGVLLDLSEMVDGGYQEINISLPDTAAHNLNVYVTRLDGTPAGFPVSWPFGQIVAPGETLQITNLPGPDGQQGCSYDNRLMVRMVYWLGGSGSEIATVTASTEKGLPSIASIDSTGCAQRGAGAGNECTGNEVFNRKINVTIPR